MLKTNFRGNLLYAGADPTQGNLRNAEVRGDIPQRSFLQNFRLAFDQQPVTFGRRQEITLDEQPFHPQDDAVGHPPAPVGQFDLLLEKPVERLVRNFQQVALFEQFDVLVSGRTKQVGVHRQQRHAGGRKPDRRILPVPIQETARESPHDEIAVLFDHAVADQQVSLRQRDALGMPQKQLQRTVRNRVRFPHFFDKFFHIPAVRHKDSDSFPIPGATGDFHSPANEKRRSALVFYGIAYLEVKNFYLCSYDINY